MERHAIHNTNTIQIYKYLSINSVSLCHLHDTTCNVEYKTVATFTYNATKNILQRRLPRMQLTTEWCTSELLLLLYRDIEVLTRKNHPTSTVGSRPARHDHLAESEDWRICIGRTRISFPHKLILNIGKLYKLQHGSIQNDFHCPATRL